MKHIIVGTDRPESRSMDIGKAVHQIYSDLGEESEVVDLRKLKLGELTEKPYQKEKPASLQKSVEGIEKSEGLIFIVPEYNGSYPGILKYFIDHWSFPDCFEYRPVCFIGLGWQWGGLRPVEHLQQVMGYRNAYAFPKRVFIQNIGQQFTEQNELKEEMKDRLKAQAQGFSAFMKALQAAKLDANSLKN